MYEEATAEVYRLKEQQEIRGESETDSYDVYREAGERVNRRATIADEAMHRDPANADELEKQQKIAALMKEIELIRSM